MTTKTKEMLMDRSIYRDGHGVRIDVVSTRERRQSLHQVTRLNGGDDPTPTHRCPRFPLSHGWRTRALGSLRA